MNRPRFLLKHLRLPPEAQGTSSEGLLATAYFLRASCQMQLTQYAGAVADFEAAIAHGYAEDAVLEQLGDLFVCR